MAKAPVEEIGDDINATVKRALERLNVEARSASQLTSEIAQEAGPRARNGAAFARREMRHHPARNVAIGVGFGVLAAVLLTRGAHRKH